MISARLDALKFMGSQKTVNNYFSLRDIFIVCKRFHNEIFTVYFCFFFCKIPMFSLLFVVIFRLFHPKKLNDFHRFSEVKEKPKMETCQRRKHLDVS